MAYTPVTWVEGVTKLGPTNMNHLEQGLAAATNVGSQSGFNVKTIYGAVGNGVTDDTAAIQAAINAASAAGGGQVFLPSGSYKVTSLNLKQKVSLLGAGMRATILVGTAGSDILVLPTLGGNSVFVVADLGLSGGRRCISYSAGATADYCTYVTVRDVEISGPSAECVYTEGAIEEWYFDNVRISGGTYGFRHANVNNSSASNYVDKCTFKDVWTGGQTEQGWRIEALLSNNVTWLNPIIGSATKDGFYADGGIRGWTFSNVNTEANGQGGKNARTTGSITTATPTLTVALATGFAVNDPITVAGAGANGADLTTTIGAIAGTTFTLAVNASSTVASRPVTNATYDDIRFNSTIAGSGNVTFLNGIFGGEASLGRLRYSINLSGCGGASLVGVQTNTFIPIYDPGQSAAVIGGACSFRTPAIFTGSSLQATMIANQANGEFTRTQIPSPPGNDILLSLIDSTANGTGTHGAITVRRYDPNRTRIFYLPAKGPVTATGSFTMVTKAGTPTDADFEATPGDGTIVVDTTANKIWTRIGGVWKGVVVA